MSSRAEATERTKNFSPSGNVDDSVARTWLKTMSPSAAKYFGRSATHFWNSIGRTGTVAVPLWWSLIALGSLRAWLTRGSSPSAVVLSVSLFLPGPSDETLPDVT